MTGDPTRDRVTEAIARRAAAKGWTWDDLAAAALATMTSAALAAMTSTDERPMRDWVVERTWLVRAQSATKALEATARRDPDHVRTYEGPPRPWEAP